MIISKLCELSYYTFVRFATKPIYANEMERLKWSWRNVSNGPQSMIIGHSLTVARDLSSHLTDLVSKDKLT